jgi:hypothetical protein
MEKAPQRRRRQQAEQRTAMKRKRTLDESPYGRDLRNRNLNWWCRIERTMA